MVIDEWAQGVWKSVQKEYLVDQKKEPYIYVWRALSYCYVIL